MRPARQVRSLRGGRIVIDERRGAKRPWLYV